MTQVTKYQIDDTREGSKNLFYDVTNQLSKEEFANFQSEWKEIEIFGPFESGTIEDFEKISDSLQLYKDEILQVFDFFITSLEIVKILYSGIQSLMSLVVNYIYETIYNQLDMLLRTGVYSLTVTPDFQDSKGLSLPITSLSEQAENAYNKFYDFKDPSVPYALSTPQTEATDAFKTEGDNFIGRLNAMYDKDAENKNKFVEDNERSDFFKSISETNKPYFESNFQDAAARMELLSKPGGMYEGIFLYFSFDLKENLQSIFDFIDAIGKFEFFFENKSLHRIRNQFVTQKVKKIRVTTRKKLDLKATEKYSNKKITPYDNKSYSYDEEMKDKLFILPYFDNAKTSKDVKSHGLSYGTAKEDFKLSFDEKNKATILSCESAEKETKQTQTIYYSYIDRIHNGWGNSNSIDFNESDSLNEEFYTYEFTIELDKFREISQLDGITAPFQQDVDYFNETQRVGIFDENDLLGEGYILENTPRATTTETKGSWFGTSFTDLIGVSDNIKNLQSYVAGKRNTFQSNLFGINELISDLKTLKSDIIRMIDMLEAIINLLNISIEFDGKIYAKYVREENYDKFTTYLTDYSSAPPTPKQIFKPSANATIKKYISKIKKLQENHSDILPVKDVDKFLEELDQDYGNDEAPTKELDSYFDKEEWGIDEDEMKELKGKMAATEIIQGGLIAGPVVVEQLGRKIYEAGHELGSAIGDLLAPVDQVQENIENLDSLMTMPSAQETSTSLANYLGWDDENTRKYNIPARYNYYVLMIKEELSRATADLSREFGFSQVFVTYLPKGFKFQPIALLADRLGLVDQRKEIPTPTEMIENVDRNAVNEKLPNNTIQKSEGTFKVNSAIASTTTGEPVKEPVEITINNFIPYYDNATIEEDGDIQITSNQLVITANGKKLGSTNHYGVLAENLSSESRTGKGIKILIDDNESRNENYIYLLEFKIGINVNIGSFDPQTHRPRYSKIRVNGGLVQVNDELPAVTPYRKVDTTAPKYGYLNNNDDGSQNFKFGQLKEKTFTAKIFLSKAEIGDKYTFYPFFSIWYDASQTNVQHFGTGTTFTIDPIIKFYRSS